MEVILIRMLTFRTCWLLISMVTIFLVCWLPLNIFNFAAYEIRPALDNNMFFSMFALCHLFGIFNQKCWKVDQILLFQEWWAPAPIQSSMDFWMKTLKRSSISCFKRFKRCFKGKTPQIPITMCEQISNEADSMTQVQSLFKTGFKSRLSLQERF